MTDVVRTRPTGDAETRHGRWVVLVAFWVAFGAACVAAVVVVVVERVGPGAPECPTPRACGGPPPSLPPGRSRTWTSTELGFHFQYSPALFEIAAAGPASVRLQLVGERRDEVEGEVWITGVKATDASPPELLQRRRDELGASIVGLTEDTDPSTTIPPPKIGLVPASGGSFRGTVDSPQGPTDPAVVVVAAASDGRLSVVVSYAVTGTSDADEIAVLRAYVAPILTSFEWTRGAGH